jgi:D-alanyl-D-alanine carboxypeptidase
VARGPVPWSAVADLGKQPAVAGFALPAPAAAPPATQFAALSAVPAIPPTDDEDAAESRRAPDENFSNLHSQAPQLETVAQPPRPAPIAAIPPAVAQAAAAGPVPQARPQQAGDAKPVVVAALPKMRPTLRSDNSEGDLDLAGMAAAGRNWTIQIGAYADQAFAKAQLDAYAQKSMDVLGQAARLVVPFQSSDGHTMYRARFGLFAERKAREVCDRLTQRGQTCFAAIAAR